jgi:hypothetical protein
VENHANAKTVLVNVTPKELATVLAVNVKNKNLEMFKLFFSQKELHYLMHQVYLSLEILGIGSLSGCEKSSKICLFFPLIYFLFLW